MADKNIESSLRSLFAALAMVKGGLTKNILAALMSAAKVAELGS